MTDEFAVAAIIDRMIEDSSVILADPPWKFLTRSVKGKGRSADGWYEVPLRG